MLQDLEQRATDIVIRHRKMAPGAGDSEQLAVGSWQWAVGGGRWAVGGGGRWAIWGCVICT